MKKEKQIKENLSNEINPEVQDPLTEVLREGARKMLALAIEAEVEEFISQYHTLKDEGGRRAIVRNGYPKERDILTGLGSIPVSVPRVRDRRKEVSQPVQFTSSILPKYLRKTKSMEELIPWLYLKGVSTNDFPEALQAPLRLIHLAFLLRLSAA